MGAASRSLTGMVDPAERIIVALDRPDAASAIALVTSHPRPALGEGGPGTVHRHRPRGGQLAARMRAAGVPRSEVPRHPGHHGWRLPQRHPAGLESPTLLAVTVLTSWATSRFVSELQVNTPMERYVPHLARLAAADLRAEHSETFVLVTPRIRPAGSASGDQQRVTGPAEAIAACCRELEETWP